MGRDLLTTKHNNIVTFRKVTSTSCQLLWRRFEWQYVYAIMLLAQILLFSRLSKHFHGSLSMMDVGQWATWFCYASRTHQRNIDGTSGNRQDSKQPSKSNISRSSNDRPERPVLRYVTVKLLLMLSTLTDHLELVPSDMYTALYRASVLELHIACV